MQSKMANSEKHFPASWISSYKLDVTDDYVKYARPLRGDGWVSVAMVDGIMRLAKFKPIFAEKKLEDYVLL